VSQEQERAQAFNELTSALMEVGITVGLLGTVIHSYPEHVQENFLAKIHDTVDELRRTREEFEGFGEFFDEEATS
jgi:hypothetical protein